MKLRLCIGGKSIVADGVGVALTIFVGEDGAGRLSLAASNSGESGEYVTSVWVDDQPLQLGESVTVDMVENIETTAPSFKKTESSSPDISQKD